MRPRCKGKHEWIAAGWGKARCVNCPRVISYELLGKLQRARDAAKLVRAIRKREAAAIANAECPGCNRSEEPIGGGRWRKIKLQANGECRACNEAEAEIAARER
jgi:hypothetical protein